LFYDSYAEGRGLVELPLRKGREKVQKRGAAKKEQEELLCTGRWKDKYILEKLEGTTTVSGGIYTRNDTRKMQSEGKTFEARGKNFSVRGKLP